MNASKLDTQYTNELLCWCDFSKVINRYHWVMQNTLKLLLMGPQIDLWSLHALVGQHASVRYIKFNLHILCFPLMGNLTMSSWGWEQTNTNGLSDSPSGNYNQNNSFNIYNQNNSFNIYNHDNSINIYNQDNSFNIYNQYNSIYGYLPQTTVLYR